MGMPALVILTEFDSTSNSTITNQLYFLNSNLIMDFWDYRVEMINHIKETDTLIVFRGNWN